jgi:hypothetical protein
MKRYFLIVFIFETAVFCFGQSFGDLPFANPDPMTYFQQEMTSLMRFQVEHSINVPFFFSFAVDSSVWDYDETKIKSIAPRTSSNGGDGDMYMSNNFMYDVLLGFQIKINHSFYIPLYFFSGESSISDYMDKSYYNNYYGEYGLPAINVSKIDFFIGSGLFFDTDKFKGSVYVGGIRKGSADYILDDNYEFDGYNNDGEYKFTIAFLPIVNTSNWNYIGKALNYIMGFAGMGDVVYNFEEEGDSKFSTFINALNLLFDFSFNRIHFEHINLDINVYYKRGNYDVSAKTDTYGLRLQWKFIKIPLAFSIDGGFKNFYMTHPYNASSYHDTGFLDSSIYITLGCFGNFSTTYQYDSVDKSKLTFSYFTNSFSLILPTRLPSKKTRTFDGNKIEGDGLTGLGGIGGRFRWGGWKVGK